MAGDLPEPGARRRILQQLRQWLAAEQRQRAWEQRWAKRLGWLFASLIALFLLAVLGGILSR